MYGMPGVYRFAEEFRTSSKATIKRASKAARRNLRALDKETLQILEQTYKDAIHDIKQYLAARAGDDNTIRLDVMRSLLDQAESRMNMMAAQRNDLLETGLLEAAGYGVEPVYATAGISGDLSSVAHEAVQFVANFVAEDGLQLSDRIWAIDNHAKEVISNSIQRAVVQGHSASQAAQDFLARGAKIPPEIARKMNAAQWDKIYKDIKSGVLTGEGSAYANARRLFRTEINRAHGEAYQSSVFEHPDVIGTRFLLSPNHPKTDICDMHARVNRYGLGPGVYPEGKNPWPAHPNTLSFVEAVFADEVTAEDRKGKENRIDWLNRQDATVQSGVLGARSKQAALRQGVLRESEIKTPWNVLKKKYTRRGIDITGAVPGSVAPGPGSVINPNDVIIKTSVPADFPAATTLAQAGKIAGKYVKQTRAYQYIQEDSGEYLIRFRHGPKYLPDNIRSKKYNKVSFSKLRVETSNATNRMLHELDQVAEKLGLPALRGVNTSAGSAAASMGDGVLAISKYNNRYFGPRMSQAEAIMHYKRLVKDKNTALERFIDRHPSASTGTNRVIKSYQADIDNLKGRLKQLEDGVSVDVVTNPPSNWTPNSSDIPPNLSDKYFSSPTDKYKSTLWHEFGHHIHQQLGVTSKQSYLNPPLEANLSTLFRKPGRVFPSRYSKTNHKEWFAESYALYRLGRSDLIDRDLLALIHKIESGGY